MKVSAADMKNISNEVVFNTKIYTTPSITPFDSSPLPWNLTSEVTSYESDGHRFNYVYVLLPLGALLFITIFTFVVIMLLRKSKMDKLRQHLMPLYNFDPTEEDDDADWENELLEEDKEQQVALNYNARSPLGAPQLKFHHMDRIV